MGDRVVCGYLIVRRPEANFDEARKTVSEHQPSVPNINGKYYSGVDRMPWADITEKYYARALPEQLEKTWEEVQRFNGAYQDICITPDIQWAIQLLEYSNREDLVMNSWQFILQPLKRSKAYVLLSPIFCG